MTKTNKQRKQADLARSRAMPTGHQNPGPRTAEQELASVRDALAREEAKPAHKQQLPVLENLRARVKAAERNAAAS